MSTEKYTHYVEFTEDDENRMYYDCSCGTSGSSDDYGALARSFDRHVKPGEHVVERSYG